MTSEARIRIDEHRLMRQPEPVGISAGTAQTTHIPAPQRDRSHTRFRRRTWVHVVAFFLSFVVAAGVLMIGILLFVGSSENITGLVILTVLSGLVFVASFTAIRMLILHRLYDEYPDKEEDPGLHHHLAKSVVYGCVALALALFLVGLIIRHVSAFNL